LVVTAFAYVISHLAGVAFIFGLLFLTAHAIAGRCGRLARDESFRVLLEIALGTVTWTGALFALAAAGQLRPLPVWSLVGIVLALSIPTLGALFRDAWTGLKPGFVSLRELGGASGLLIAGIVLVTLCACSVALLPGLDWDDAVYHLNLPKIWLRHQGFVRVPYHLYSSWPLNFELLYSLGMIFDDHVVSKLIHFGFGLLLLCAIASYARSRGSAIAGICAVVLFLANQTVLFEFTTANVELGFAFFFLLAFVLLERHLEGGGRRELLLSAVCCGYLAGAKFTGLFVLLAMLLLLLVSGLSRRASAKALASDGLLYAAVSLALAVPWYLKSFLTTGDPFHPMGYAIFGGPEWSAALNEQLHAWYRSMGMGRSPWDYLMLPLRLVFQSGEGYERFNGHLSRFWAVLLPVSLLPLARSAWARRVLFVASVYFACWALSSQQARFLVPMLPFLSINAAFGLSAVAGRLRDAGLPGLAAAVAVALPLLALGVNAYGFLAPWQDKVTAFFAQEKGPITAEKPEPMFEFINAHTPPSAKLLFLNINFGFWCEREYLADSAFEASQMNELIRSAGSESELAGLLARMGITHILYASHDWKIPYPGYLRDFLEREAAVAAQTEDGILTLYALRR
jgi:hypothetical protein